VTRPRYLTMFKSFCSLLIFCLSVSPVIAYVNQPPTPTPAHFVIFDQVGQMASSMTYIHVAIPLNISTFQHQISLFQSYLNHFRTLKTNQTNAIPFTKAIRDLANFASERLESLTSKLRYIDHILPADTEKLHPIVKRSPLLTAVPYSKCKTDLAFQRLQCEKTLQSLVHQQFACEDRRDHHNHSLHSYPDLPEFHEVFINASHTTPAPPPATTTFSAFRKRDKRFISSLFFPPMLDPQGFQEIFHPTTTPTPTTTTPTTPTHLPPLMTSFIREKRSPWFTAAAYASCQNDLEYETLDCNRRINIKTGNLNYCKQQLETFEKQNTNQYPDFSISDIDDLFQTPDKTTPISQPTPITNVTPVQPLPTDPWYFARTGRSVTSSLPELRPKRQILAAAALATGVFGTFFGLYDWFEIQTIKEQVLDLSSQHNLLVQVSQRHEKEIQELDSDLSHLAQIIRILITYNPALIYAKLQQQIEIIHDRISTLSDTLQQLQHHRLSVNLLNEFQLQVLHTAVLDTAAKRDLKLLPTKPQDFFQIDTSYIRINNDVLILLHVPCITSDHLLTIYHYVPFPYPLHQFTPSFTPSSPIHTLRDALSSPAGNFFFSFDPCCTTPAHTCPYRSILPSRN